MIRRLFNKETINGTGNLYSTEHNKSFRAENTDLKLEQDKDKPENIHLTLDGTSIHDWFCQKQQEFLHSIGINPPEQKNNIWVKI